MYNLNSHYENIFQYLNTIVTDPRLLYLMPYGSTQPENFEFLMNDMGHWSGKRGPLFVFYDQEPILGEFNHVLFDYVCNNFLHGKDFILVTTEKNSKTVDEIKEKYGCPVVYYFHHVFAAHDWYRGVKYDSRLIHPLKRKLTKKYITFNRLTSSKRVYRSLLISELAKQNVLSHGYVSYNDSCPEGGTYQENLTQATNDKLITEAIARDAINNINRLELPLRIDYQDQDYIPNHSFVLSAVKQTQESFVYLVTETCFWETKCHLTEKIFKPIVSRMPFLLVGPAHNLKYLRSYGFKTFSDFWDESYDDIEDPIQRLSAVCNILKKICSYSLDELESLLLTMIPILEHNYNLFNSEAFVDHCWDELKTNLANSFDPNEFCSIYAHESRTKQF